MNVMKNRIDCAGFLFLVIACMLMNGCDMINPAEPVPSYIEVDSIGVFTDEATQGSSSSRLSDVWVTVDGTFLGGYELPARIPLLYEGEHTVQLRAGILLNGIEGTRVAYGVFDDYKTTVNFQPGGIQRIVPQVTYFSYTHFPLIEDFDHSSLFLDRAPDSDTGFIVINDANSFESNCGAVYLDNAHSFFKCQSVDSFSRPDGNAPVYIEINYKCNAEFTVGVKARTDLGGFDQELLIVRSSADWKKIYVNLTPVISQTFSADDWKIYLYAAKPGEQTTATLYFDNIKLVY